MTTAEVKAICKSVHEDAKTLARMEDMPPHLAHAVHSLADVVEALMTPENPVQEALDRHCIQAVLDRFRRKERIAIVKWLREVAGPLPAVTHAFLQDIAARIEKGEHEKPLASPLG